MGQKSFLIKKRRRYHGMMLLRQCDAPVPVILRIPFGSVKNKKDRPIGKTLGLVGVDLNRPLPFPDFDLPFALGNGYRWGRPQRENRQDRQNKKVQKSHGIRTPCLRIEGGFYEGLPH